MKKTALAAGKTGEWRAVNRVQLAALLGVHPDTVTDFARDGMPVQTAGGRGRESVYDAVDCLDWWRQRQGKNAKEAAQTRAYEAQAKLNEMKIAVQRGELVPRDEVIQTGQAFVKAWTAKVRGWPRRLVQAGIVTREQEGQVTGLALELLREMAGWKTAADLKRAAKDEDAD